MAAKRSPDPAPEPPLRLLAPRQEARDKLHAQLAKAKQLLESSTQVRSSADVDRLVAEYGKWNSFNKELLRILFSAKRIVDEYEQHQWLVIEDESASERFASYRELIERGVHELESLEQRLDLIPENVAAQPVPIQRSKLMVLTEILKAFHRVVRQLRHRRQGRPTLEVKDEYDVQDLLHALLKIDFSDVRPEEWTPSYAGQASRTDFLLKDEQIVVETKKTRDTQAAKSIGGELIIDIARYRGHPDCKTLVCFIYDPESYIQNPEGLKNDLERSSSSELTIKVFIEPK